MECPRPTRHCRYFAHLKDVRLDFKQQWTKVLLGTAVLLGGCEHEDDVELRAQAETGGVDAEDANAEIPLESGEPSEIPAHYIVMLKPGANPFAVAAAVRARPEHVYNRAISGFAGPLNHGQVEALSRRKDVARIELDQVVYAANIQCPTVNSNQVTTQDKSPAPDHAPAYSVDRLDQRNLGLSSNMEWPSRST
jgi:hypothetical protein